MLILCSRRRAGRFLRFPALGFVREGSLEGVDGSLHWLRIEGKASDDAGLQPRKIKVFYGNGAPSGPNNLLFSAADRLAVALWDRSKVGWSPTPHTPVLGALRRALDPKLWGLVL